MSGGGRRPAEPSRAVLLRSVDFGESDRVLTFVTERHGRVSVIARGARRSQRRFLGALEPFAIVEASIALGAGELGRLAEARVLRAFPSLISDLDAMREAGRALELVRALVPEREPEPGLLDELEALFAALDASRGRASAVAAYVRFGLRTLAIVGLAPRVDGCVGCDRRPSAEQPALFDVERGGIVCRACGGGPVLLSAASRAVASRVLEQGGQVDTPTDDAAVGLERLLDAFVERHAPRRPKPP